MCLYLFLHLPSHWPKETGDRPHGETLQVVYRREEWCGVSRRPDGGAARNAARVAVGQGPSGHGAAASYKLTAVLNKEPSDGCQDNKHSGPLWKPPCSTPRLDCPPPATSASLMSSCLCSAGLYFLSP
ncbi:unnamed protein product [Gadus morhua 'NCC']